jgi:hypothetical protein
MTIAEIDAHPDADRIWATIAAMHKHVEDEIERREDEIREDAYGEQFATCQANLALKIEYLLHKHGDGIGTELQTAIEALDCTP